ncbi:MAG: hypothetical protein NTV68_10240 [Methanomicrobiales archaeon]|nr:hypothetical protein [Methanomicrobiales archaeon]
MKRFMGEPEWEYNPGEKIMSRQFTVFWPCTGTWKYQLAIGRVIIDPR